VRAGGELSYAIGLLALSAVVAIVFTPVSVALLGQLIGRPVDVPVAKVATTVVISVLGPLLAGVLVKRVMPGLAERLAGPLSRIGMIVLVLGLVPILVTAWPALMAQVGDFTLVAIVL